MEQQRRWPSTVWIVRHGESEANVALSNAIAENADEIAILGRDADVSLSEAGVSQARAAGQWFRNLAADRQPERVLCSPFKRARQTADIIIAEAH